MEPGFLARISEETGVPEERVAGASRFLSSGIAIPFVARYRKEATGGLDEPELREMQERLSFHADLHARRAAILRSIEEQGKLTAELREKIEAVRERVELEDLYLPFRPKRKTQPADAMERALEPLVEYLLNQETDAWTLEMHFDAYVDPEKGLPSREAVIEAARRLLAQAISEMAEPRGLVRRHLWQEGVLVSRVVAEKAGEKTKYAMYYDRREALAKIPSHRVLAIRRGTKEAILTSSIECNDARAVELVTAAVLRDPESEFAPLITEAARDGYSRLLRPEIESEIRGQMKERADREAIRVFQVNLANLLLSPAAGAIPVAAVNPKKGGEARVAVVDESGQLVPGSSIAINLAEADAARAALAGVLGLYPVRAIAVGNGPGSREVEAFVRAVIEEQKLENVFVAAVNDSGLAAYALSRAAREELPDLETAARATVSIARRLQDPLGELVKIEPRAIGVGQYQHDVNQRDLSRRLLQTVSSCVCKVGVDLNRAPAALLRHVAGLSDRSAASIVAHREKNGPFRTRAALAAVPDVSEAAYIQAAGFLRVNGGDDPLDRTGIHPEQVPAAERIAAAAGAPVGELVGNREALAGVDIEALAAETASAATLRDIRDELMNPGRDPRRPFRVPRSRSDVKDVADLKEGMTLEGTVTNVTNFGAFVDVGVRQDGLVHLSQISNRFIRDPREAVRVGDVVSVKVLSVDSEGKRIALSMKALLPVVHRRKKPRPERPAAAAAGSAPREDSTHPGRERRGADGGRPRPPRGPRRDRPERRPRRHTPAASDRPRPVPAEPAPEPRIETPPGPELTLQEKLAILQMKFPGSK
jgi:uncharacterized protein